MNRNKKVLLLAGAGILVSITFIAALIATAFYFHIFRIANIVSGGG